MSALEAMLRLSLIQTELREIAGFVGPKGARIVRHAATVLNLLRALDEHG
jgi:hypothetical protein